MKFKYIMVESWGIETPVIFQEWVNHKDVSLGGKVISAGEVRFIGTEESANSIITSNIIKVSCSGESTGLKVKSRGAEDAEIIQRMLESQWN